MFYTARRICLCGRLYTQRTARHANRKHCSIAKPKRISRTPLQLDVVSHHPRPGLLLHWGVNDWDLLPVARLPPATFQVAESALQSPFRDGKSVSIAFPEVGAQGLPASCNAGFMLDDP